MRPSSLFLAFSTLFVVAAAAALVAVLSADFIESRSEQDTIAELRKSGHDWVVVDVDGLLVRLTGIADSEAIYTILSPAGATMAERLHHPSLFAEQFFGTPVPEPSTLAALALLPLLMRRRRAA